MVTFAQLRKAAWNDYSSSPEEKKLVRKLDFYILTFCCVSFFFNYLDRAAFANAYVAGLQKDLGLVGDQYSKLLSILTAGYVVGQYPHSIIIQKVSPRIWFPSMIIIWAALTMCSAAAKTYAHLCVIRFFQGVIEASTYCGTLYVMGSWLKPQEIAKRTAIFSASGQAGTMFAGIMMTAVRKSLDGRKGLAGWQWVFIIDGVITLPIAIFGFLTFPDAPETTNVFWLTAAEKQMAVDRLPPKKENAHNISPWSLLKRVGTSPYFWIMNLFSAICGSLEAFSVQGCFLLWLKAKKYPTDANTTYPLGISAVGICSQFLAAVWIDATGQRVGPGLVAVVLQGITSILLLIPHISAAGTFFAYYLAGTAYIVNPLLFGWANVIMKRTGDEALRSVTLYSMNAASSILYTFWGIALYPSTDAPYWKKGAITMLCVCVALASMLFVVQKLDHMSLKQEQEYLAQFELDAAQEDPDTKLDAENKTEDLIVGGVTVREVAEGARMGTIVA